MIGKLKIGLTANQIKWIALIFMTIDHSAPLFQEIPALAHYVPALERLGRISAPLFLFVLTESFRHTKSKPRFILRLYVAGVSVGVFTILTNLLFHRILVYSPGNIFFTLFYTAVYIYLFERIIDAVQKQNTKKMLLSILGVILTFIPQLLFYIIDGIHVSAENIIWKILFSNSVRCIFNPVLFIEYSIMFVIMGITIYFLKKRELQCAAFLCFSLLSLFGATLSRDLWPVNDFFGDQQYWMILAVPIMFLYNGRRGNAHKVFFYVYYPVHRYLIILFATLLRIYK